MELRRLARESTRESTTAEPEKLDWAARGGSTTIATEDAKDALTSRLRYHGVMRGSLALLPMLLVVALGTSQCSLRNPPPLVEPEVGGAGGAGGGGGMGGAPMACDDGLSQCAEALCVDLHTDSEHCGACGYTCPESCVQGACELVSENGWAAFDISRNGTDPLLYIGDSSGDGDLLSYDPSLNILSTFDEVNHGFMLSRGGGDYVFTLSLPVVKDESGFAGLLTRKDVSRPATELAQYQALGQIGGGSIASSANFLFASVWNLTTDDIIVRYPLSNLGAYTAGPGWLLADKFELTVQSQPTALAVLDDDLYWVTQVADTGRLMRLSADTSTAETLVDFLANPRTLIIDRGQMHVYFAETGLQTMSPDAMIYRYEINGGEPIALLDSPIAPPTDLALGPKYLYWAVTANDPDTDLDGPSQIWRLNVDGTADAEPELIFAAAAEGDSIWTIDTRGGELYFVVNHVGLSATLYKRGLNSDLTQPQ